MGSTNLKQVINSVQALSDAWSYLADKFDRADIAAVKMIAELKHMDLGKMKS